jgi:hypothetical protein
MFIDNAIIKKVEGSEVYDKFVLASALFGISFQGASCSLLEGKVLNSCKSCNLRYICFKLDKLVEEYRDKTTQVTESFTF